MGTAERRLKMDGHSRIPFGGRLDVAFELVVFGLQWTTEGEPFGLRQRTRHAVLVKIGLREEVDPAEAAKAAGTNAPAILAAVPKIRT